MEQRHEEPPASRRGAWFAIPLAGFLLAAVYAGAYYCMVQPFRFHFTEAAFPRYPEGINRDGVVSYGHRLQSVFAVAHWVDRRLRPGLWGPYELEINQWADHEKQPAYAGRSPENARNSPVDSI